jgi:FtsP/CotA-like multicopper oxidase with cupredoxin domain
VVSDRAVLVHAALAAGLLLRAWAAAAEPRVFELSIRGGELAEPTRVMRVRQGDDVTLRWTTDRPLTVHLHGYDLEQKLAPGKPVSMRLTARATGRFPIEVHAHGPGGDRTIGYLEVHPR